MASEKPIPYWRRRGGELVQALARWGEDLMAKGTTKHYFLLATGSGNPRPVRYESKEDAFRVAADLVAMGPVWVWELAIETPAGTSPMRSKLSQTWVLEA